MQQPPKVERDRCHGTIISVILAENLCKNLSLFPPLLSQVSRVPPFPHKDMPQQSGSSAQVRNSSISRDKLGVFSLLKCRFCLWLLVGCGFFKVLEKKKFSFFTKSNNKNKTEVFFKIREMLLLQKISLVEDCPS